MFIAKVTSPYSAAKPPARPQKLRNDGRVRPTRITAAPAMRNHATSDGGKDAKSITASAAPAYKLTPDPIMIAGAA
ncbi:hypothetical protein GCM10028828_04800 [Corynebacterium tapiri]